MNQSMARKTESRRGALLCVILLSLVGTLEAQNYGIPWYVVGKGGAGMSSANYGVSGTLAQTATGNAASANYQVSQGYWAGSAAATPVIRTPSNKIVAAPSFRLTNGTMAYSLTRECPVEIRIFDMLGQKVFEFNRLQPPGSYSLSMKSLNLSPGRYILHFKAGTMEKKIKVTER